MVDRLQYVFVLAACVLITAPLETLGTGVYRQARRAAAAVLPVALVFGVWDVIAIHAHVWTYNPRYVTGVHAPGRLPVEELLFFLVIPVCALLTYNAVDTLLQRVRRRRTRVLGAS
jgi:lycopene cyclase domain-containing protein